MKHLFHVASHLHFFLAHRIINCWGLGADNCVLLLTRGYRIPEPFDSTYQHQIPTQYNVTPTQGRIFCGWRILKTRRNRIAFDRLLDAELQQDDFLWYTPVCNNDICSLVVTKPHCKGYYVTEDGVNAYRTFNPQSFTGWSYWIYLLILKPIYPRFFAVKNHLITTDHPKFKGCVAIDQRCFPLHQQYLKTVGSPWIKEELTPAPDAILSIDPLFMREERDTIVQVYQRLAAIFRDKGYNTVGYKYHPVFDAADNKAERDRIEALIQSLFKELKMTLLPKASVLENLLYTYHADFYSDSSSVGIYAALNGSKVYSYYPLLHNFDLKHQVPFFTEYAEPIA
ncbi:MAG: hypothetical protein IJ764_01305 [Bacteroidales bacterium]|nr:hypothetical protein [Bacteroidales bacterium]